MCIEFANKEEIHLFYKIMGERCYTMKLFEMNKFINTLNDKDFVYLAYKDKSFKDSYIVGQIKNSNSINNDSDFIALPSYWNMLKIKDDYSFKLNNDIIITNSIKYIRLATKMEIYNLLKQHPIFNIIEILGI